MIIDNKVFRLDHGVMADRAAKDALYEGFAGVTRALVSDRVAALWPAPRQVAAKHVAGLEALSHACPGSRDGIEVIGREELAARRRHLRTLPYDAEVAAYCRGPYCAYADEAVRELQRHGFRARRLTDGYPEWKRAGLPAATGKGG